MRRSGIKLVMFQIVNTLKKMPKDICPGPDGFSVEFYLANWSIVGDDVTEGIPYFFSTCSLPGFVNSAALALIPKTNPATSLSDLRPI